MFREENEMDSYRDFSYVYDELMDETPYEKWCDVLTDLIRKYGVSQPVHNAEDPLESERNLVLDLGCGTGTLTELLYEKGFDCIGIDNSEDMLQVAMEKRDESGYPIFYLHQDMRELELYSTVGTVVSVCDSVNYLLTQEDLLRTFKLVNNYLFPGGIFIFDFNTDYKYREVIGDRTIAENREDCSFIWENSYDPKSSLNEYRVTFFIQENEEDCELFRRFEEVHIQRGYTLEQMRQMIEAAGLAFVTAMDVDTLGEVTEKSERIYVVAREVMKQNV